MATSVSFYNRFKANLMNKVVDLTNDTIKMALLSNSHSFNAAHAVWSDASGNEIPGTGGYTTGGNTLTGKVVTEAATTTWDFTTPSWPSGTFTAYHAVIYDVTATNNLICSINLDGAQIVTNATYSVDPVINLV